MLLIFGFGVSEKLLAMLSFVCETCGQPSAHQLIRRSRRFTVFFIPLFSVGTHYVDVCTHCGRAIEVSRDQAELAVRQAGPPLR